VAGLALGAAAVVVAWLAHLPAEPGPATAQGVFVLVGSAIRALPPPRATAVAVGGLALVGATALASAASAVTSLVAGGWLAALATGLGLRLFDTHRRTAAELVRRDERLELARELHDVVAHHITGVVLHAQAARVVRRRRPEDLDDSLAGIEAAGSDALAAMRRVIGLLRDTEDAPAAASPEQLGDLVERFTGHGHTVRLRLPDHDRDWPPEVTSTVYRVVQESLTNIAKHAPHAPSVTVDVTRTDARDRSAVSVEVVDDAPPHPTRHARRGGYGLVGMRERVEALGGTLAAGPRPGVGWSVRAVLPLPDRERR
ncbi:MAG: sensor histidine kinase, partial [Saccharothrix sp.]|nr:sensor histidine kinase [Saccharothrix sp.]